MSDAEDKGGARKKRRVTKACDQVRLPQLFPDPEVSSSVDRY